MDRYQTVQGIVINKKIIKDSDLLVTLLTPSLGKITALAKGALNIKSSRLGSLQFGNIIKANLYHKNDHLWLSEAKTITPFLQHNKNLTQINLLFYFLEIANQLIAENQHTESIYQSACKLIEAIEKNKFEQYILHEINFIKVLGFGLPDEIKIAYSKKNFKLAQKLIKNFFESIVEKPLESNKLFK